jgi:hypothetical protein
MPPETNQRRRPSLTQQQIDIVENLLTHELDWIKTRAELDKHSITARHRREELILSARAAGVSTRRLAEELTTRGHAVSKQALLSSCRS